MTKTMPKASALSLAAIMLTMGLTLTAPSAAANHGCIPDVGVDDDHAPVGEWSPHEHPRFTFPISHCDEVTKQVNPSWRTTFNTQSDSFHETLPSGEHEIDVRTVYLHQHCSWWCWTHYHRTAWVSSETVQVDASPPEVEIADVGEPSVQIGGEDYITNETEITLAASDAHSGVDRIEWRIDGDDWIPYEGPVVIGGDEGEHTLGYRAIDNVGHVTTESRDFILDNTAPEQEKIRPGPNSATLDGYAVETCNGPVRVSEAGEPIVAAPDLRNATGDPAVVETVPDVCSDEGIEMAIPGSSNGSAPGDTGNGTLNATNEAVEPVHVVGGTVEFVIDVDDALVGTDTVGFLLDGELLATQANGDDRYKFELNTSEVEAGQHAVTFSATDRLGNTGELGFSIVVVPAASPEPLESESVGPPAEPSAPDPPEGDPIRLQDPSTATLI